MVIKYNIINCYSDAYTVCVMSKCKALVKVWACLQTWCQLPPLLLVHTHLTHSCGEHRTSWSTLQCKFTLCYIIANSKFYFSTALMCFQ